MEKIRYIFPVICCYLIGLTWNIAKEDGKAGQIWLGKTIPFKTYKTTKEFVVSMGMKSKTDWKKYCKAGFRNFGKKSKNIYAYPELAYQNRGWVSWDDWFGISLFDSGIKKPVYAIPVGKTLCRCKGLDPNCTVCDGKGYY